MVNNYEILTKLVFKQIIKTGVTSFNILLAVYLDQINLKTGEEKLFFTKITSTFNKYCINLHVFYHNELNWPLYFYKMIFLLSKKTNKIFTIFLLKFSYLVKKCYIWHTLQQFVKTLKKYLNFFI